MLDDIVVPAIGLLFTNDAMSMYTEILTEEAINEISAYIRENRDGKLWDTLVDALGIVFRNNIFKFLDTTWHQVSVTEMGISPAPWATLFYVMHKKVMVPLWDQNISFYKRFIDDVLGI
jgi:hypothetical protein